MLLSASGLVVGAYGIISWNLKAGRVLIEIAAATIIVGLVHACAVVRRLQREMAYRSNCRRKRLALPLVFAAGIAAAERQDAPKTAEVITVRIGKVRDFSVEAITVFACLIFDLLESNPSLSRELRQIARAAREKPRP
jgi:hypothetical protein